jgi:class 3 adenylate cyclase
MLTGLQVGQLIQIHTSTDSFLSLASLEPNYQEHPEVSVLFCKLDEFTNRTKGMRASVVVGLLNEIWTALDKVVDYHSVYKVRAAVVAASATTSMRPHPLF